MMLERLVNDVGSLRKAWENEPLHSQGLGPFDDVFGLDLADDLITGRGLRIPYLRLVRDGGYLPASCFTHRTGTAGGQADGVADPAAILREFGRGATVVLRGLIRYCPAIAAFCAGLSAELGIPASAGAYLTPPGSRGAGPHYDPMSVLVRQVHGSKNWVLRAAPEPWPRDLPPSGECYDTPVIAELTLRAGDSLYIPRGVVHDAWTHDEASVHITFSGDTPPTWTTVLHGLVDRAAADPALRETFRWRFADDPAALAATARQRLTLFADFLTGLDPAHVAGEIIARHGKPPDPPPTGRLRSALTGTGDVEAGP